MDFVCFFMEEYRMKWKNLEDKIEECRRIKNKKEDCRIKENKKEYSIQSPKKK